MSGLINRPRYRKSVLVEDLHESPFLLSGESGHVHPRGRFALPQVVSFFFDSAEGDSAKPTTR